jgi:hypothetical protein
MLQDSHSKVMEKILQLIKLLQTPANWPEEQALKSNKIEFLKHVKQLSLSMILSICLY